MSFYDPYLHEPPARYPERTTVCPECEGRGEVETWVEGPEEWTTELRLCMTCTGAGEVEDTEPVERDVGYYEEHGRW